MLRALGNAACKPLPGALRKHVPRSGRVVHAKLAWSYVQIVALIPGVPRTVALAEEAQVGEPPLRLECPFRRERGRLVAGRGQQVLKGSIGQRVVYEVSEVGPAVDSVDEE